MDVITSLQKDPIHGIIDSWTLRLSTPWISENMHQKFSLLSTGMYDLQRIDQPHSQPGFGPEQQQCTTDLSDWSTCQPIRPRSCWWPIPQDQNTTSQLRDYPAVPRRGGPPQRRPHSTTDPEHYRSLPMEVRSFNDQFMEFRGQCLTSSHYLIPYTVCVQVNLKNYQSNPSLFDINYSPASIGIKPVGYGPCSAKTRPACHSSGPSPNLPDAFALYLPPKDSNLTTTPSTSTVGPPN